MPSEPTPAWKPGQPKYDLAGQRFGRSTAIRRVFERRKTFWLCRCDCGTEHLVRQESLMQGATRSCGCARKEYFAATASTHGQSYSVEYRTWLGIITRCCNPKDAGYRLYGARGITICPRWRGSFEAFYEDMGPRPSPAHSIDRIDVNGHYEPGNCRWATREIQDNNRRNTVRLEWNGETKTLHEWCQITGLKRRVVAMRLRAGWSIDEALSTPPLRNRHERKKYRDGHVLHRQSVDAHSGHE